jgi:amino acid transporter
MAKLKPRAGIGLAALVASTYFMVAGGPYGLEDLLEKTGFATAVAVLVVTPFVWSLPTSLMVGELAAAIPEEGGYYAWVKRALGPFWGFQEAWLSIGASVFDMGIYPALFAAYLARLFPVCGHPHVELAVRAAVLVACVAYNLRGTRSVGIAAEAMALMLLLPFVVFVALAFTRGSTAPASPHASGDIVGGVLVAMWNTMGWDNASTIASEVDRPQRTYPLAMIATVVIVVASYVLPVGAAWAAHVDLAKLSTGGWADAAGDVGGYALAMAVVVGGMLSAVGMLSSLVLSYSRVPMALADDGYLPAAFARKNVRGVPTGSVVLCGTLFSLSLALSFERLVLLDILLYGLSLVLEFVALVVLRIREPQLARPFRVPFGIPGCVALAIGPTLLLSLSFFRNFDEKVAGVRALWIAVFFIALGPVVYRVLRPRVALAT